MIYASFVIVALLEILLPIGIFLWLKRRWGVSWLLFGVGVLTFIGSQVVQIPLQSFELNLVNKMLPSANPAWSQILISAVLLGLVAGLTEEPARLVGYLLLKKRSDSFPKALALGSGHGGIESILAGVNVGGTLMIMLMVQRSGQAVGPITPDLAAQTLGGAWFMPLISLAERIFAVVLHLTFSVMVWWAVSRRAWIWFLAAVLYHALVDAFAVGVMSQGGSMYIVEGVLFLVTLLNLGGLVWLKRRGTFDPIENRT